MASTMPTIAIYFSRPGKMDAPFDTEFYFNSYGAFCRNALQEGAQVFIVRGSESYLGNLRFSHGWRFDGQDLVDIDEPIQADLIYMKADEFPHDEASRAHSVNRPGLHEIANDKAKTYALIPEFMAKSIIVEDGNWEAALAQIPSESAVFKPLVSAGGKGIVIARKDEFTPDLVEAGQRYLVQEFLDASPGIPGIVEGLHDLRILMFNDQPTLTYVRIPKEGSLLANVSQGGTISNLTIPHVPAEVLAIASQVDRHFAEYSPRIYTIDFMYANGRPYVVELNPQPGFPGPSLEGEDYVRTFHAKVLQALLSAI